MEEKEYVQNEEKEQIKEKGGISVDTEHIFPVIKRWLYSDKDIFLRELVSNGCDAITKMKRLVSLGEAEADDAWRIDVKVDKALREIRISDNGLGMTADEIKKYINQIALSGALEFIEKYEGSEEEDKGGIIGHFGLGFYSAFMIAKTVEIHSLSYQNGAESAFWRCSDAGEFELEKGSRTARGTEVILHVNEEEAEYLEKEAVKAILNKYCAFMPVPIYFEAVGEKAEEEPLNDPEPLWLKAPSACTEEEYNAFYHKVFSDPNDPLFYIHINAEFPLNFKGILYFPKLADEYAPLDGQVKLFYNQVFVADNIKEVIPEYMMLLRGVLDCPELPLNVSRSYLQANGYVAKISAHIVKKICDKLHSLFNNERERYNAAWDDIKPFVEYGCTRDPKFFEKISDIILFKTTDGEFLTKSEYFEKNAGKGNENTVYYASDKLQQVQYIQLFKQEGITVALLDGMIDTRFISFLEMSGKELHFVRIDSDPDSILKKEEEAEENEELLALFKSVVPENVTVAQILLKSEKTPALLTLSEEKRRLGELIRQYSGNIEGLKAPEEEITLSVNMNCPLIARIASLCGDEKKEAKAKALAKQVYMLSLIAQRSLKEEELQEFIDSSIELLYNA